MVVLFLLAGIGAFFLVLHVSRLVRWTARPDPRDTRTPAGARPPAESLNRED